MAGSSAEGAVPGFSLRVNFFLDENKDNHRSGPDGIEDEIVSLPYRHSTVHWYVSVSALFLGEALELFQPDSPD
jgi:hypothetical protein